ncbi:MAG TPA: peptidyl-alpha-hydroxyglycine alpha-amidating lyase family protein [Gammaproteobacteria bacterium]|nr:peptidyl-alpha-hydroxyglycine alpha-amidating lyase family protein [Gammaproteobacteria bacterium]
MTSRNPVRAAAAAIALLGLLACSRDVPNPYRAGTGLLQAPPGRTLGSMSMVDVAPDGTLWVAERCGENNCLGHDDVDPVLHVSADGEWLGAFGAGLFAWPHGIYVDREGNVWVTDARGGDDRGHQVIKFSPDGRELLRLGTAARADGGPTHFNGPTDVVVAANGDVFVSDGHEAISNNRIVKFARDGTFIKEWGATGSEPGQFIVPHALALDSTGRLFVADRDNNRIQIFDQDGNFLDAWTQFGRPSGIHIAADDTLYVSDNQSNDERHRGWPRGIYVGSAKDGSVSAFIPDPEFDPAQAQETGAHGLAADAAGAIYGAEVYSQSVKKYVR